MHRAIVRYRIQLISCWKQGPRGSICYPRPQALPAFPMFHEKRGRAWYQKPRDKHHDDATTSGQKVALKSSLFLAMRLLLVSFFAL